MTFGRFHMCRHISQQYDYNHLVFTTFLITCSTLPSELVLALFDHRLIKQKIPNSLYSFALFKYTVKHMWMLLTDNKWQQITSIHNESIIKLMSGQSIEQQHKFLAPKTLFRSSNRYSHFFTGPFASLSAVINQLLIPDQSLINCLSSQIKYFCWNRDVSTKTANPRLGHIRGRQMDTIEVTENVRMPHTNLY